MVIVWCLLSSTPPGGREFPPRAAHRSREGEVRWPLPRFAGIFGGAFTGSYPMADGQHPVRRSHLVPRTGAGWIAVIGFLLLFAMTQPPLVFLLANRIEPRVLGMPFLYVYLLIFYVLLIGVLVWAQRQDV